MCENRNSKENPRRPWPQEYPKWLIEVLEYSMEETGMSREEAEEGLQFELLFGASLMQEYLAKLKAHQKEEEKQWPME